MKIVSTVGLRAAQRALVERAVPGAEIVDRQCRTIEEMAELVTSTTLLADALGSTIGLVGSAGSIATNYTYQPFGAVTTGGAANTNPYQFTGRENDGTGLYFYRARYYSPMFQRFIGQDPIGFNGGDANMYSYVGNAPIQFIDSLGLIAFLAGGGRSSVTGSGNETSAGVYHDATSGLSGCFESYGTGHGANASAGGFLGAVSDLSSLMGYTRNYSLSFGFANLTLIYNAASQIVGFSAGLGLGSPLGATSTDSYTSPESCSCAPRRETPYAEFHNADPEFQNPPTPEFRDDGPEFRAAP